ncbi:MAG: methyltransferase domain-containing protein [Planctomycetes bacterium]|nr:methyltransferase domain-containing protein [Planctomycetota bacterium]
MKRIPWACPCCRTPLETSPARLACAGCGAEYPIRDGRPWFLGDGSAPDPSWLARPKNWIRRHPRLYEFVLRTLSPILFTGRSARALLRDLGPDALIVEVGAGNRRRAPNVVTIDIYPFPCIDAVADAGRLPLADGSVDGIASEVVLEHLQDPRAAVEEMARVLRPGGLVWCVVPFLQPFHGAPSDFGRFTTPGVRRLFDAFDEIASGVRAGPTSALIWIVADWLAIALTLGVRGLRAPISYAIQALLSPLKLLDLILARTPEAHVVASLLYFYGRKTETGGRGA